jgi:hypothetical protein
MVGAPARRRTGSRQVSALPHHCLTPDRVILVVAEAKIGENAKLVMRSQLGEFCFSRVVIIVVGIVRESDGIGRRDVSLCG